MIFVLNGHKDENTESPGFFFVFWSFFKLGQSNAVDPAESAGLLNRDLGGMLWFLGHQHNTEFTEFSGVWAPKFTKLNCLGIGPDRTSLEHFG